MSSLGWRLLRRSRWLLRAGLVVGLTALHACNTPFIPIPPPGDPTFTPVMVDDGMGGSKTMYESSGGPSDTMADATVFILNADLGSGVITRARADGSYVGNPMDGDLGDRIEVHYQTLEGEVSPVTCRILTTGLATTNCP